MRPPLFVTLACTLVGTLSAQSFYIPSNTPTTGTCSTTAYTNLHYQCMASAAQLQNSTALTICDLALAPCGTSTVNHHFDTIEIVLAQTKAVTLSTTFSANLATNVQTVLKAKNFDWPATGSQWNRIGFDKSYSYRAAQGANLVIQITVTGAKLTATPGFRRATAQQRLYATGWSSTPPATGTIDLLAPKCEIVVGMNDLQEFGVGCKGSNGKVPGLSLAGSAKLGQTFTISLSNARASVSLFQVLSITRYGSPIDMSIPGAPGCFLYQPVTLLVTSATSATGTSVTKYTVPNDRNLICQRFYTQFWPFDKNANSFGLTASNQGRILVGN